MLEHTELKGAQRSSKEKKIKALPFYLVVASPHKAAAGHTDDNPHEQGDEAKQIDSVFEEGQKQILSPRPHVRICSPMQGVGEQQPPAQPSA